jgi:Cu/Ag efflux protein CusF
MRRMVRGGVVVGWVAVGLVVAGSVVASTAAPTHRWSSSSSSRLARVERSAGVIEGKLTRVDGRSETVDVSIGFLGLLGKTLEVNRDTRIQVNGQGARFADLQEGAKVKAFYEERGAKLVATRIEVSSGG